jgi:hypothetical protein
MLRRIFGLKRDEVMEDWKKLHNEKLHNLHFSPNIIRMTKSSGIMWGERVEGMEEKRNAYRVLMGKSEGKRSLGIPRRRWEDNIKMDLG